MELRMGWGPILRTIGQLLDGQAAETFEIVRCPEGLVVRRGAPGGLICAEGHSWKGIRDLNDCAGLFRRSLAIGGRHRWDRLLRALGQDLEEEALQPQRIEQAETGLWVECGARDGVTIERRWWSFRTLEASDSRHRERRLPAPVVAFYR